MSVPDAARKVSAPRRRIALWGRTGLGIRIFVGVLAVIVLQTAVLGAVAYWVGSRRFGANADYYSAIGIAMAASLVAAVVGGAAAAWFIAGRLSRPLDKFATVARAVSAGDYSARVEHSGLGPQFDDVETAFGDMTARLQSTEQARSELVADLSHEMRTPLMTLTTYLEALEDGVRPPLATTWEVMADQVRRLGRLANDMSTASADQEGALNIERRVCDVAALAQLAAQAGRDGPLGSVVRIEADVPRAPVLANVDASRIEQVLTNLIDNAARHARGATWVRVSVRPEGHSVAITVQDDGSGVAAQDQGRIFDRFYRADRSRTGTGAGLGLAISRSIVQAHGGQLTYTDRPGGGSTFTAALPTGL